MKSLGKVVVLGDSYSTFEGGVPQGNLCYYSPEDPNHSGVTKVEETWWHQLISATDSQLVRNDSWSGSTMGYTGYEGQDYTNICFNTRLENMYAAGTLDGIDTLLIFGGTNDDWCGAPIGELKYADWTREEMYSALPAIGRLFTRAKEMLPEARIYAIINTWLKPEIHEGLIAAAEHNGVKVIRLTDFDKNDAHPSLTGMAQIKDQLVAYFEKELG